MSITVETCGKSYCEHYPEGLFTCAKCREASTLAHDKACAKIAEARDEIERLALELENKQYTITCASEENQQLKESLAEARAEIENLKWKVNNEKAKAEAALALNDRALELVNEARAEIFELKKGAESDTGTILRQANSIRTIGEELADKDKQLAKARAEIERKNKLIEQTLKALERLSMAARAVNNQRHDNPDPVPLFVALGEMLLAIRQADEVIATTKGEA